MKKHSIIILTIITIIAIIIIIYTYSNASNGNCPYCGGKLTYEGKIYKNDDTWYRYRCTEHSWHYMDLIIPVN